jgi:iron complex outermembrane receptor protein
MSEYDFEVLGTQSNVFVSIQNILDKDPPITPTVYTGGGALPNIYDAWGRMFRAGVRVKF